MMSHLLGNWTHRSENLRDGGKSSTMVFLWRSTWSEGTLIEYAGTGHFFS